MKIFFNCEIIIFQFKFLVVDECHCVLSWGQSEFRPAFLKLGELRSIVPSSHIVALTATATKAAQTEIAAELQMKTPAVISRMPDRYCHEVYSFEIIRQY